MAHFIPIQPELAEGHPAHAYLIEAHTEKVRDAAINGYAKHILCRLGQASEARFDAGVCPDLVSVETEKITIDQVRELTKALFVRPLESRYKVLLIRHAGEMRQEAQNALLKSIEEPPEYVVWLLATNNRSKLLPTVRSRCRILSFGGEAERESAGIDGVNRMMGWALTGDMLNVFTRRRLFDELKDNKAALLDEMSRYVLQALHFKSTGTWREDCPHGVRAAFGEISDRVSVAQCAHAAEQIERMRQLLAVNINATLMLEELLLSMGPASMRDAI